MFIRSTTFTSKVCSSREIITPTCSIEIQIIKFDRNINVRWQKDEAHDNTIYIVPRIGSHENFVIAFHSTAKEPETDEPSSHLFRNSGLPLSWFGTCDFLEKCNKLATLHQMFFPFPLSKTPTSIFRCCFELLSRRCKTYRNF